MAGHVVGLFRTPPKLQEAGYDLPLFEGIAVVKSRDQERYRLGPAVRTAGPLPQRGPVDRTEQVGRRLPADLLEAARSRPADDWVLVR